MEPSREEVFNHIRSLFMLQQEDFTSQEPNYPKTVGGKESIDFFIYEPDPKWFSFKFHAQKN